MCFGGMRGSCGRGGFGRECELGIWDMSRGIWIGFPYFAGRTAKVLVQSLT